MNHDHYMSRCFDLARLGAGRVSPNPMVGAVLVHQGRIIGEGWHMKYGEAHAEVNALKNVFPEDRHLIEKSTLYVSLEPCCIHGKTPPCTNLILENKIKKVVISCIDQTPGVKGGGVAVLQRAGVEVIHGVMEDKGKEISAFRNTFTAKKRPFVQLKFAQTKNGFMGQRGRQVWISNLFTKRLAHQLRSESDAILIGKNTALADGPKLTNRLWFGHSPLRIVLDKNLDIPAGNPVFGEGARTWVVTEKTPPAGLPPNCIFQKIKFDENLLPNLLAKLFENKVTSLIVEGGAYTLQQFVGQGLWDEALVFTGNKTLESGIAAPKIPGQIIKEWPVAGDLVSLYRRRPF
ncbi:MAG TPA: bifunctional diaminohydroxyphosphoribosylaminopyrimidine deaminase/5-amino-6-(5-phosphoribosylamino)uracil reductase RibD [Bacteroidetes bacterium]|nr:bifunctional diaminohydroxyphosphoribosylaminopyrimidine deaminase/5-amino-6-(5-phosphoribosylamino)uracil reductase RibD [Bacteroidota bacterium]